MLIVNSDALSGPHRRALAEFVLQIADNFDEEYMRPDDPFVHGRQFTVIEAGADIVLRLTRDRHGNETITIVDVSYYTDAPDNDA